MHFHSLKKLHLQRKHDFAEQSWVLSFTTRFSLISTDSIQDNTCNCVNIFYPLHCPLINCQKTKTFYGNFYSESNTIIERSRIPDGQDDFYMRRKTNTDLQITPNNETSFHLKTILAPIVSYIFCSFLNRSSVPSSLLFGAFFGQEIEENEENAINAFIWYLWLIRNRFINTQYQHHYYIN